MSWQLLYVFKCSSAINYSPLPFRTWPLLHCCSYFKGSSFTMVTILPLWACSHVDLCHTAQLIVAHILCVGWIKKKKTITEIYLKTFRVKAAATDFAALLKDNNSSDSIWLTTSKFQWAGVCIHWKILQVHGALSVNGQPAGGRWTGSGHDIVTQINKTRCAFLPLLDLILYFVFHDTGTARAICMSLGNWTLFSFLLITATSGYSVFFFLIWPHGWAIKRAPDANTVHMISLMHV